jgi:GTP-binding protein HflX
MKIQTGTRFEDLSSSNKRMRSTRSAATLLIAALVSQPASALVGGWGQPSRSTCSSSRLHVLTNHHLQESTSAPSGDENENNELFSLDEDIEGDTLYQVQGQKVSDEPPKGIPNKLPEPFPVLAKDEEKDLSYFYRDDDDMLTEREDRMYMDGKGIRRKVERCILVGVEDLSVQYKARRAELYYDPLSESGEAEAPCFTLHESMTEMKELIRTAGLDLCGEMTQRLQEVNPKTYIGTGKVLEVQELMEQEGACTIVFDAELSPGQQKRLENAFNQKLLQDDFNIKANREEGEIKVLDRTALILDIFAQHAKTREGKLQVDLALHEYRKPRLTKMWTHLERQSGAGGVGLRGPGESQLEIDRRLVRDRIIVLKQKIDNIQKQRAIHRRGRERTGLPVLSLVGYTNSGKSSMLNYLTHAGVMAESMLFATLDPTTRKVKLPGYKTHPEVLLTDTVGFIQKLPTNLVAAFRATLEEVQEADVLIHVIDVSNPTWEKQERAVLAVLRDIEAGGKPIVRVFNKIDLLDPEDAEYLKYEAALTEHTVAVSSLYGDGMQDFVAVVEEALADLLVPIEMEIPYSKGDELNAIHEQGNVETIDYRENGTYVVGRVPRAIAMRLDQYSLNKAEAAPVAKNEADEIDWVAIGRGRHQQ